MVPAFVIGFNFFRRRLNSIKMIHEIFPHNFDNKFQGELSINADDYIFHFKENLLLLKRIGIEYDVPRKNEISGITEKTDYTFLFSFNNYSCFLVFDIPETIDSQFEYIEINSFRTFQQKEIAWIGIVAFQLMNWYNQNKFCGKCGTETKEKSNERAIICPDCNTMVFPKISPAIIVAIVCNDKILLAHNSNFPENWYSLVAGYADIGESLEESVIREVKEEVGLDVTNIRYYKSQPWPYSGSMMIGFIAEASDAQSIVVDNIEINDAKWFTRGNLPNRPTNISIAGEMIDKFERGDL
jgi:NAD+ diphosphatase